MSNHPLSVTENVIPQSNMAEFDFRMACHKVYGPLICNAAQCFYESHTDMQFMHTKSVEQTKEDLAALEYVIAKYKNVLGWTT
jgi:hypothetical protein